MTTPGPIRALTERQQEIVDGLLAGGSYAEIGTRLGCSARTVETHVRQIANLIDGLDELPPRWRIYAWAQQQRWEREHQMKLDVMQAVTDASPAVPNDRPVPALPRAGAAQPLHARRTE